MSLQFRSPDEKLVHVSSTFAQSAVVGPEWRELPASLHRLALEKGCISSAMSEESINPSHATPRVDGVEERLRAVLIEIRDNPGEDDLTKAGIPNMNTLAKKVGYGINRDDALRVWAEVKGDATP